MKVKDWMTREVVTVSPEMSVKEAFLLMKKHHFRHLPVVKKDKLVGFVTDRDLRRPAISDVFKEWNDLYRLSDEIHVEDVMIADVMKVTPDMDLKAGAAIVLKKKIGALPVVEGDRIVGIITIYDFLKALVEGA
jgi:acetoin utilization protein AcuB